MKTILFITSDSTYKVFDYVIEELGEEYKCFVVDSLAKALKVLEAGIDQVVIYPFYIKYYGYNLNLDTTQDTRVFAGYCFWKQELAEKAIKTIVINSQKLQVSSLMSEIEKIGWHKAANVIFFDYNKGYQSSLELANLIKIGLTFNHINFKAYRGFLRYVFFYLKKVELKKLNSKKVII